MAANTANVVDVEKALDLQNIRSTLMRMEDSIVFSLVERAQYKRNGAVYSPDCDQLGTYRLHQLKAAGSTGCLGDWFIYQTECLHSQAHRYEHPTEFAFFGPLPPPTLGAGKSVKKILEDVPASAVINSRLLDIYRTKVIPHICEEGDDANHGSTAVQDVHCLQMMATRIYYGLFVAESKFRTETEKARALIRAQDRDGLMAFITKPDVEAKNVQRVILKARTFSQTISAAEENQLAPTLSLSTSYKVSAEFIGAVFSEYLMPLTKDVEVEYLLKRSLFLPGEAPSTGQKRPREP